MSLRSRVDALMAWLRPGRLVIVRARTDGTDRRAPDVRPLPERDGLVLLTSAGTEGDPAAALTADQRALIGPHDQLVIVAYEDRSIDGNREGDARDADDDDE